MPKKKPRHGRSLDVLRRRNLFGTEQVQGSDGKHIGSRANRVIVILLTLKLRFRMKLFVYQSI